MVLAKVADTVGRIHRRAARLVVVFAARHGLRAPARRLRQPGRNYGPARSSQRPRLTARTARPSRRRPAGLVRQPPRWPPWPNRSCRPVIDWPDAGRPRVEADVRVEDQRVCRWLDRCRAALMPAACVLLRPDHSRRDGMAKCQRRGSVARRVVDNTTSHFAIPSSPACKEFSSPGRTSALLLVTITIAGDHVLSGPAPATRQRLIWPSYRIATASIAPALCPSERGWPSMRGRRSRTSIKM